VAYIADALLGLALQYEATHFAILLVHYASTALRQLDLF
jgi:hypothetical protein